MSPRGLSCSLWTEYCLTHKAMKLGFRAASNCQCSHPTWSEMMYMGPSSNKKKVHEKEAQMPIASFLASLPSLHHVFTYELRASSLWKISVFWERRKQMIDLHDVKVPPQRRQEQWHSSVLGWIWETVVKRNPLRVWNMRHCLNVLQKWEQCIWLLILYERRHGRRSRSILSWVLWLKVWWRGW